MALMPVELYLTHVLPVWQIGVNACTGSSGPRCLGQLCPGRLCASGVDPAACCSQSSLKFQQEPNSQVPYCAPTVHHVSWPTHHGMHLSLIRDHYDVHYPIMLSTDIKVRATAVVIVAHLASHSNSVSSLLYSCCS